MRVKRQSGQCVEMPTMSLPNLLDPYGRGCLASEYVKIHLLW